MLLLVIDVIGRCEGFAPRLPALNWWGNLLLFLARGSSVALVSMSTPDERRRSIRRARFGR
jgi:hypothetical protein